MTLTPIGLNFTAFQEANFTINISTNPVDLLNQIPAHANSVTNGFLAYGILFGLLIFMYFVLSDKTAYGDFGYDDGRALCISSGLSFTMGITLLEINFITNLKTVGFFMALFTLTYLAIIFYENKQ